MIRKPRLSEITVISMAIGMSSIVTGQNSQQEIEEIEVFADSRRTEGITNVNAAISVLGEEELDLILLSLIHI